MRKSGLIRLATAVALAVAGAVASAEAQSEPGRYALAPLDGGIARLDTQTGDLSECRRRDDRLTCTLVPDERQALMAEIDRLKTENERLRAQGSSRPPAGAVPVTPPVQGPSDADIDRALNVMEKFLRRFQTIMRDRPGEAPL